MSNPIGGPNLNLTNQLAQKNAADARLVAKDSAKGANLNATTIARQSNNQADVRKASEDASTPRAPLKKQPEEVFVRSTPAETPDPRRLETRGPDGQPSIGAQTSSKQQVGEKAEQVAEKTELPVSQSAEALTGFTDALFGLQHNEEDKKEFTNILEASAGVDTRGIPGLEGDNGRSVAMASVALKTAVAKLQAKMPNATPEQIREAAKSDPEIAKWAAIADSSQNYLQQFNTENPNVLANAAQVNPQAAMQGAGVPGPSGGPGGNDPFASGLQANATQAAQQANQNAQQWSSLQNQAMETQAQIMAERVKTMQSIQNIYQQMWAEVQKARAERHKILMETANSVNSIMMELHVSRARSSQKMFNDMLNTLTGNYK